MNEAPSDQCQEFYYVSLTFPFAVTKMVIRGIERTDNGIVEQRILQNKELD